MWQPRRRQKKSRRRRLPLMWRLCAQRWRVLNPPTLRKAAAGSSLFLIHTHGRLSMSLLPTSGCVVKEGGLGGVLHSLFSRFFLLLLPPFLSLSLFIPCHALPLCHRLVCLAAASHHLLQAVSISLESPLLFSESDSFSAALSSPLSSSPPPSTFPLSRCSSPPPPSSSHIHASFYSSLLSLSLYFIYFFLF